jgi:hypothetical protein
MAAVAAAGDVARGPVALGRRNVGADGEVVRVSFVSASGTAPVRESDA